MPQNYVPVELRQLTRDRALARCEYCLLPDEFAFFPHQIDHVVAQKHGGATEQENLAWACVLCNIHKGSDLTSIDPKTGQLERLFNPREDNWQEHFRWVVARIEPLTSIGRVTERLLQLNMPARLEERLPLVTAGIIGSQ